jgi:ADP-ribose pyrophosphatase
MLPKPPAIRLEVVADDSPPQREGFLRLVRRRYRAHYPDGSTSEPFEYDAVHRTRLDAVVIVAHHAARGERQIYLRSAVRPPLLLREPWRDAIPLEGVGLWELPAGLVEPEGELGAESPVRTAQREIQEELGFEVPLERIRRLGASLFPTAGLIAERINYFELEVDPLERREPTLDGSPLERAGLVVSVGLKAALAMCTSGDIVDLKTELGLRRLEERLA